MSEILTFHNPGEIDLNAVRTLGVSVKESENPVGYFGTGLKFAIATILREGGSIVLYRGEERFAFETLEVSIRGEEFKLVTMNGERLGYTTMLGRTWEPWMAYRELLCNAYDEGGAVEPWPIKPKPGRTLIEVDCEAMMAAHRTREAFMIDKDRSPIYRDPDLEIYPARGSNDFIFYRGIRASAEAYPCKFRYNVLSKVDLSEDRLAKWHYQIADPIARVLLRCEDRTILREAFEINKDHLEFSLAWNSCGSTGTGEAWLDTVAEAARRDIWISLAAEKVFAQARKTSPVLPEHSIALRPDQEKLLRQAIGFLHRSGYKVDEFPIIVTDRLGSGIVGRASAGRIYLSLEAFTKGEQWLAATLLEEWIHLSRGFRDYSVQMQNFLFEALIDQARRADFLERGRS